jgi:hypothetical protein
MGALSLGYFRNLLTASIMTLTIGASTSLAAEANKPRAYLEPRFLRMPILHVDGQQYDKGWFEPGYSSAAKAFDANPEAAKHFNQYLSDMSRSQYIMWGTLGTALTFFVMDRQQWHLPARESDMIFNAIVLAGYSTSFYYLFSGAFHLPKALNVYNGLEISEKSGSSGFNLSVAPVFVPEQRDRGIANGGGLSFKMTF